MKKLLIIYVLMLSILSANIDDATKAYYSKDFKKALPILEQLSKEGNIESNYYLGTMYYSAYGVKHDYKKAFKYFTLASDSPNKKRLKSRFNIALMYMQGKGVKVDNKKVFSLLKVADFDNIGIAQYLIGILYTNGFGVPEDQKKAVWYYNKGCNSKIEYPKACYYAGNHYERGIGVKENYSIAKSYYQKGCELGYKESCEAIKNMREAKSFFQKYNALIVIILLLIAWWRSRRSKKNSNENK